VLIVDEVACSFDRRGKGPRYIVLSVRDGQLQRVSELYRSYNPLQYPLRFPYGDGGYCINNLQYNGTDKSKTVVMYAVVCP